MSHNVEFSNLKPIDSYPKSSDDIIVAIDFGTSRTGIAWGYRDQIPHGKIEIQPLEGSGILNERVRKTPTIVLLKNEHNNKPIAYGQKAREKSNDMDHEEDYLFRCFKMNLHEPFRIDPDVKSVNNKKTLPLSVVIQKSLEYIKNRVLDTLYNQNILSQINPYDIVWVVTVPAIWTDVAKYIMRKATFDAGMIKPVTSDKLIIALEPECAFLSAINSFKNIESICDKGKKCIIVDCGSGTVDITGYEIQTTEPLVVREIIIPSGGHLGSNLIDQKFYDFIKKFIGEDKYDEIEKSEDFNIIEFEKSWEECKLGFSFDRENDDITRINLSYILPDCNNGIIKILIDNWNNENENLPVKMIRKNTIGLSYDLMMSFFQEPIESVIEKVNQVLSDNRTNVRKLDYIILAGGFCRNMHLIKRMNEEFRIKQKIRVIIGEEPDLSVVKGASIFGCDPSAIIKIRKAKYTFGVHYTPDYDLANERHRKYYDKIFIGSNGIQRLNLIDVHGRIGDDIVVGKTLMKRLLIPVHETQSNMFIEVYISPNYDPFHVSEKDNKCLAKVNVDLDMNIPYKDRGVQVEFSFGNTEVYCYVYNLNGTFVDRILLDYSRFFS